MDWTLLNRCTATQDVSILEYKSRLVKPVEQQKHAWATTLPPPIKAKVSPMPDVFPYRLVGGRKRYIVNNADASQLGRPTSSGKQMPWAKSSGDFGAKVGHVKAERSKNVRSDGSAISLGVTSGFSHVS
jgi:hypothetical protein